MLSSPPSTSRLRSWLWVMVWTLFIFTAIPLARRVQEEVAERGWRKGFGYFVITFFVIAAVAAMIALKRSASASWGQYLWLAAVAAVYVCSAYQLKAAPEEAFHFVQYGVLGFLAFRALSHDLDDLGIYVVALLTCVLIGTIDELVQWITPRRHWGFDDIMLNAMGSGLMQLGIALGLRPAFVHRRFAGRTLGRAAQLLAAEILLLTLCVSATPARVDSWAPRVPGLGFLAGNPSVINEFGYLYEDPAIGRFRSRLTPQALARADHERAAEAAAIIDEFAGGARYGEFLQKHGPTADPFVHELRVHIFRRDRFIANGLAQAEGTAERSGFLNVALREDEIVERYFKESLHRSSHVLTAERRALLDQHALAAPVYDSAVSKHLMTALDERRLWLVSGLLCIGLLLAAVRLRARSSRSLRPRASSSS